MRRPGGSIYLLGRAATPGAAQTRQFLSPDLLADEQHVWPLDRPPLHLESSQPGLFVAGDVRHGSIKRVASAVGEGAMAVALIHRYLRTLDGGDRHRSG